MNGDLPIVLCRLYQVIDFRVHQFENAFLSCLLVAPEFFRGIQDDGSASGGG